jgi:hypothetical protein
MSTVGSGVVYAQYGQEALNPNHQRTLQEQLDLARIQTEKQQLENQQSEQIKNSFFIAEIGIPIVVGISVAMFLSVRKRR